MQITERNFSGRADLEAMAVLVRKFPAENLHVVDLPYRLSSWSFDFPENIRLWNDENGQLVAWAALQVPFWTVDYAVHPEFGGLHPHILKWADEQAQKIMDTPSGHPAWFVTVLASQTERIRDLEQAGFASQANVGDDSWTQVLMEYTFPNHAAGLPLPEGFIIRPLNGFDEVQAYVDLHQAVFQSKNMTVEWRQRTLQRPEYIPELDLVAVAPDGQLAAFCICWLAKDMNGQVSGQIEPLGVHADFRKLGLARAILVEGLKRLSAKGAQKIHVQTDNYRNAAFHLYESAGFHVIQDILMYRKDYE